MATRTKLEKGQRLTGAVLGVLSVAAGLTTVITIDSGSVDAIDKEDLDAMKCNVRIAWILGLIHMLIGLAMIAYSALNDPSQSPSLFKTAGNIETWFHLLNMSTSWYVFSLLNGMKNEKENKSKEKIAGPRPFNAAWKFYLTAGILSTLGVIYRAGVVFTTRGIQHFRREDMQKLQRELAELKKNPAQNAHKIQEIEREITRLQAVAGIRPQSTAKKAANQLATTFGSMLPQRSTGDS